jgi:hypothetical protein
MAGPNPAMTPMFRIDGAYRVPVSRGSMRLTSTAMRLRLTTTAPEHLHLVHLGGIELDDGAAAETKHLVDGHRSGAEHHHEIDGNFIEGWHRHSTAL